MNIIRGMFRVFCAAVALGFFLLTPTAWSDETPLEIKVTPVAIDLQSNGNFVTVHTNINEDQESYTKDDAYLVVSLQEGDNFGTISCVRMEIDNQGNYVPKFDLDEVKGAIQSLIVDSTDLNGRLSFVFELHLGTYTATDEVKVTDTKKKQGLP